MTLSLRDVFSFTEDRLRKAELLLAKDEGQQDDAIRLALRAYIRNTMLLERFADDPHDMLAEATDFATRAIEQAPQNAVTLAVASIIASRNRNVDLALDLARQAERADPNNPLSRDSLSSALTEAGEDDLAFQEAIRARAGPMTALSPATWLMRCAATAIRARHLKQALRFARMAHGYAPNYRPALRFMAALEFRVGNEEAAADALQKLHMLEPDFSLKLMASDAYPVATLRTSGLLEVTKSGLF
jgi:tetratricopeptide (TPR) repeat protein